MLLILSSFLHDVTVAILVCWNKETVAVLDVINMEKLFLLVTAAILVYSNKETVAILDVINIK